MKLILMPLTVMLFSFVAVQCSKDPDLVAIEATLDGLERSIEGKDFDKAVTFLTPDYSDNFKQDREKVLARLKRTFGSYDRLELDVGQGDIKIDGRTASTEVKIKITGYRGEKKFPLFGAPVIARRVQLDLQKRAADWEIVLAHIHQGGGLF